MRLKGAKKTKLIWHKLTSFPKLSQVFNWDNLSIWKSSANLRLLTISTQGSKCLAPLTMSDKQTWILCKASGGPGYKPSVAFFRYAGRASSGRVSVDFTLLGFLCYWTPEAHHPTLFRACPLGRSLGSWASQGQFSLVAQEQWTSLALWKNLAQTLKHVRVKHSEFHGIALANRSSYCFLIFSPIYCPSAKRSR